MELMLFPFERVVEINAHILSREPGMRGSIDLNKLRGALGRIDNAILYEQLDDIFEIAAKYAKSIAIAHAMPDANKRTALAVALEYLSLNDYEIQTDNDALADVMVAVVLDEINEKELADILYTLYLSKPE
ncbi:MAG: type II toxin-antitoxin system death-on-curing family toxin [Alishewanella agri]|nr:type II toxin-antitoxin system death-on-curing family toxin [Alishewanella sp. HH-ZS]MDD4865515.1 type II toxin-antitoxin system death-on-curing family toxin [Alishewanella agri]OCW97944.1 death-on-curing protein [Alishewanella sp. HH-ZS]